MEEYVEESERIILDDEIRESYDKEQAYKDWGFREGHESGYNLNMNIEDISKVTGLSVEEIKKFK